MHRARLYRIRCGTLIAARAAQSVPPKRESALNEMEPAMNWAEGWFFEHGPCGWSWVRLNPITGDELIRSEFPFKTLIECVQDAYLSGFRHPEGHPRNCFWANSRQGGVAQA